MEIARESIFVSSLRSFFRCFFSVFGILCSIIFFSIFYSTLIGEKTYEEKTEFSILPDLEGRHQLLSISTPAILQIKIHGVIGELQGPTSETIKNILIDSRSGMLSNNRVKGILLHINSPGGAVFDSDDIYRMIKAYKEKYHVPVLAYVDGLCASGGMYVASSADQIFASPPSVIGSVGVIMGPFFNVTQAMEKVGVESKTLTAGLDKDMLNPFRSWKTGEDESLKAVISSMYSRFVQVVTENRPKVDKTKLLNEYGAQVFDGPSAELIGYIDHANIGYEQALASLLHAAQIPPEQPYQLVELKPKHDWLATLMNAQSTLLTGKIEHHLNLSTQKTPNLSSPFAYLYDPERCIAN